MQTSSPVLSGLLHMNPLDYSRYAHELVAMKPELAEELVLAEEGGWTREAMLAFVRNGADGEEPHARRIARAIVRRRPLARTGDLVAAVRGAVPRAAWPRRLHVATRTFQAIRMAVNDEPGALRNALAQAPALLTAGGRLGVISFHSGEDRIVKQTFRALGPAGFAELEPSPRQPSDDEVRVNPRARSAKLRVLERLP